MSELIALTYSQLRKFQACPRAYLHTYIEGIEPTGPKAMPLTVGSAFHAALEARYKALKDEGRYITRDEALAVVDKAFAKQDKGNIDVMVHWHRTRAMVSAYLKVYPDEAFEVVDVEREFQVEVVNPATGAPSRTYVMAGKVDGVVRLNGSYWLLEHKTTSLIDVAYIEKLWTDFQIHLYAHFMERELGAPVVGVLYNVVQKCKLWKRTEETEEAFAERYAEACKKNKSGKSSIERETGETWAEFETRCEQWFMANADAVFHREEKYLKPEKVAEVQGEVWDLTQTLLAARRFNRWHRNSAQCYAFNRPCDFEPLCRSADDPLILATCYQKRQALNEELGDSPDVPAF